MNNSSEKTNFIFFGCWDLGKQVLLKLLSIGNVLAVVSSPGREDDLYSQLVWETAKDFGIPCIDYQSTAWREEVNKLSCDIIVSSCFPRILKSAELEVGKTAAINLHQSLLPRHRGPSPIQHAIISGDEEVGVTVHVMAEKVDAGKILTQWKVPLCESDTIESIVRKMKKVSPSLVEISIDLLSEGEKGLKQDHSLATDAPKLSLPWNKTVADLRQQYSSTTKGPL